MTPSLRPPSSPLQRALRGMATLAAGGVLARLVSVVSVPVLTRIYAPQDYGLLAVYVAFVQLLLPVMTLRYPMAMPLPRSDRMALNLLALSLLALGVTTLLLIAALALWGAAALHWASADRLAPWGPVLVLGVFGGALAETLNGWVTRKRDYRLMARRQVMATVGAESTKILAGLVGFRPGGLLAGQLLHQWGGVLGVTRAYWHDFRRLPGQVSRRQMGFLMRYYWSYPVQRLPSQFLLAFAMQAPMLYTARIYGPEISGQLALALGMLALPVTLIAQNLGRAFYAEAAKIGRNRPAEVLDLTKKVQVRLFLAGILPAAGLIVAGPELFGLFFGARWQMAGEFAAMLAVYTLLQFTSAPLMQVLNLFHRQGSFLLLNLLRVALILALFAYAERGNLTPAGYVNAYAWLMAAFYAGMSLFVLHAIAAEARKRRPHR